MEVKRVYKKPEISWIEVSLEGVIASSINMSEEILDGPARSKRNFWEENQ